MFKIIYRCNNNEAPNEYLAFITGKELFNRLADYWCYKDVNFYRILLFFVYWRYFSVDQII